MPQPALGMEFVVLPRGRFCDETRSDQRTSSTGLEDAILLAQFRGADPSPRISPGIDGVPMVAKKV